MRKHTVIIAAAATLIGCASVDFNAGEDGAVYYEPLPYLLYARTDKCVSSATAIALQGAKRYLGFRSGYGSSSLSAEFSNGLLVKVGQTSDSAIPDTLTAIGALGTGGILKSDEKLACEPKAVLFPIENGIPNLSKPLNLNLNQ